MKFTAMLDVNVVAHETDDDVTVLLELEAPAAPDTGKERPANTLQVVLDRSGSMAGRPLAGAIDALVGVVAKLDSRDRFGVVVFDDEAQVVVPCAPLTDKGAVVEALRSIHPGGSTDLGAGYLRGLQELRRVSSAPDAARGGTLLVISDGHVNCGITDTDQFADLAAKAQGERRGDVDARVWPRVRRDAADRDRPQRGRQPRVRPGPRRRRGGDRGRGRRAAQQGGAGGLPDDPVLLGRADGQALQRPPGAPGR